jgi:hypothetical protein
LLAKDIREIRIKGLWAARVSSAAVDFFFLFLGVLGEFCSAKAFLVPLEVSFVLGVSIKVKLNLLLTRVSLNEL